MQMFCITVKKETARQGGEEPGVSCSFEKSEDVGRGGRSQRPYDGENLVGSLSMF